MLRLILKRKTNKLVIGLAEPPLSCKIGLKVFKCVPKREWVSWIKKQTALLNEYKLDLSIRTVRQFLFNQLSTHLLFSDGKNKLELSCACSSNS
ncbi:putative Fe(II) trafficking protein YggX [Candidatus Tremblaya phenacola PAVE]|nr:putative Fe(II) trafficking protein YggX [Candidatus Tremblaya phenacola PAVE]